MNTPTHRPIAASLIGRREILLAIGAVAFAAMLWLLPSVASAASGPVAPEPVAAVMEDTCPGAGGGGEFGNYKPSGSKYNWGYNYQLCGNAGYFSGSWGPLVPRSFPTTWYKWP